ncbi:hypothetical protein E2C01_057428 [Portunus trituberculatus]|uniref:Uncharacterized protein n=1 Tax=Portunus trituberculatus TaxID=210409 RepID=A0A5B7GTG1_PORTR|nr:hypothetical protein [Portunus trituberculatus]
MADSDVKESEMLEGSQPSLERLEDILAVIMERMDKMEKTAQETNVRMDKIVKQETSDLKQELSEIKREISENKQETSAAGMQMDLMREEMLTAVGEAKQFTVEHSKRLRQDLTEEFREELIAVRQQCEGRTELVETKVGELWGEVMTDEAAALPGEAVSWHVGTL